MKLQNFHSDLQNDTDTQEKIARYISVLHGDQKVLCTRVGDTLLLLLHEWSLLMKSLYDEEVAAERSSNGRDLGNACSMLSYVSARVRRSCADMGSSARLISVIKCHILYHSTIEFYDRLANLMVYAPNYDNDAILRLPYDILCRIKRYLQT